MDISVNPNNLIIKKKGYAKFNNYDGFNSEWKECRIKDKFNSELKEVSFSCFDRKGVFQLI